MMREKLIELLGDTLWGVLCDHCGADKGSEKEKVLETTADWLLENGVIVPPCKIGDYVYFIKSSFSHANTPMKYRVLGLRKYSDGKIITCVCVNDYGRNRTFTSDAVGKTVFLTREAAEQALKEVQYDQN